MEIKKIYVMADVTRCKDGTDGIINWMSGLISGIMQRICDIPFHFFTTEEVKKLHLSLYDAYGINLSNNHLKYDFLSVPVENWTKLCFEEPNEKVLDTVSSFFGDGLVITREPALILKKAFEKLEIPYVDLAIHSVRYMDDLIMGATSNIPEVYEKLKKYEINEEEFYFYADLLKSEALFRNGFSNIKPEKNYALFLAQTPVDRSLLDFKNKKIVSLMDYKEEFETLAKEHEKVFYKPHPLYQNNEILSYLKNFNNVEICTEGNTYFMFALPQYKTCAAISSGSLKEAYYFGKKTVCFLDQPYHYSEEIKDKKLLNKDIYITIGKHWLTASFWSDVLSPIIKTKPVHCVDINNVHNKLRRILNCSWGYIDCDSVWVHKSFNNANALQKIPVLKNTIAHLSTCLIPNKTIRRNFRNKLLER